MTSLKNNMLDAAYAHAHGEFLLHKANIQVYMKNPAGIGEHSDIMEAVQAEMDKIAVHADRLATLGFFDRDEDDEVTVN